jgi:transcription-repair coupling factor (superfamily II helicase)
MIAQSIIALFESTDEWKSIRDKITQGTNPVIEGIPRSAYPFFVSAIYRSLSRPMLVIVKNATEMQEFLNDISVFIEPEQIAPFPSWEILPYEYVTPSEKIERERITTLSRCLARDTVIIVATVESLMRRVPCREYLKGRSFTLLKGTEYPFDNLIARFASYGYARESRVEVFGQFSVKGGIIDIFLPSSENPVRIDFFGDTIESIREFDPESQVSQQEVDSIQIVPRREIVLSAEESRVIRKELAAAKSSGKKFPDKIDHVLSSHEDFFEIPGIEDLFPLAIEPETLADYLPVNTQIILLDRHELNNQIEAHSIIYDELWNRKKEETLALPPDKIIVRDPFDNLPDNFLRMQTFVTEENSTRPDVKSIPSFSGKISAVRDEIKVLLDDGWKIIIMTAFEGQARRMSDLFSEFKPPKDNESFNEKTRFQILLTSYSSGLRIASAKILVLTDHDIFGKSYKRKKSFKGKKSRPISSFLELVPGDSVVHINHGIGIFKGIERMTAGGIERDFLNLEYAQGDKLYVSLDQLNMVQKYIGMDGKNPRIDALGKNSAWNRIKEKVQRSVEEIAQELIAIYARRKALKGFQFPPDTLWQEEFESKFEYEETPDQLSAIEDVKDDMESSMPMDRLVCGDVGFGKTEVAIRAAFKSVMAGRQVAILAPTTILAMQHFKTFQVRYEGYPFTIGMVSRFRSAADIKKTKNLMKEGKLDIVIGTHALLSKDVEFKNLGLLVIDEEQRFGVKHKETIKKIRSQVDVVTLSATPIPRTLHMSMAGMRDLSIIATPPENRQSIETYVLDDNPDIVRMAIIRELDRGGQVFVVHNRVQTIDMHAESIKNLVPHARIAVAHGQMFEHELEDIMLAFIEDRFDILVATSIIESGLDMPNVNTIIIDRADTFGLSQLYQLKGRVGRSDRKGYAYLFHPAHVALTEVAQKRLNVIAEYADLGSGFKIAMKDLEIRGAGNILGHEQSGNIMDVGFDLYCQMLEDAVRKLKGEKPLRVFRTPVFLNFSMFIPESYISDEKQKMEFYKRFEACESIEEIDALENEVIDRFGEYPVQVRLLIEIERIRTIASMLLIDEILEDSYGTIRITISEQAIFDFGKLASLITRDARFAFDPVNKSILRFKPVESETEKKLNELKKWLQQLA